MQHDHPNTQYPIPYPHTHVIQRRLINPTITNPRTNPTRIPIRTFLISIPIINPTIIATIRAVSRLPPVGALIKTLFYNSEQ